MKKSKVFLKIILILVLLSSFYFIGYLQGHDNLIYEKNFTPKIVNTELYKPKEVDFSLFWDVWNKIDDKFIGDKDVKEVIYGAISGMVSSLNDPYSVFMNPTDKKQFMDELSGEFEGIGAEIGIRNNKFVIIAPLDSSPAQKAGLKSGDGILKINGKEIDGLSLNNVIGQIRGKKGTKVTITILRNNITKDYEVTRNLIKVKSVSWELKQDNIAYMKISQFGSDTSALAQKYADEIVAKSPKGIILEHFTH